MPGWLTVAEAAERAERSTQWVRDQIRSGQLAAEAWKAGTKTRLRVDSDDLERRLVELRPSPYRVQPRIADVARPSLEIDGIDVDRVLAEGLAGDIDRLHQTVARLSAELERVRIAYGALEVQLAIANKAIHDMTGAGS